LIFSNFYQFLLSVKTKKKPKIFIYLFIYLGLVNDLIYNCEDKKTEGVFFFLCSFSFSFFLFSAD